MLAHCYHIVREEMKIITVILLHCNHVEKIWYFESPSWMSDFKSSPNNILVIISKANSVTQRKFDNGSWKEQSQTYWGILLWKFWPVGVTQLNPSCLQSFFISVANVNVNAFNCYQVISLWSTGVILMVALEAESGDHWNLFYSSSGDDKWQTLKTINPGAVELFQSGPTHWATFQRCEHGCKNSNWRKNSTIYHFQGLLSVRLLSSASTLVVIFSVSAPSPSPACVRQSASATRPNELHLIWPSRRPPLPLHASREQLGPVVWMQPDSRTSRPLACSATTNCEHVCTWGCSSCDRCLPRCQSSAACRPPPAGCCC